MVAGGREDVVIPKPDQVMPRLVLCPVESASERLALKVPGGPAVPVTLPAPSTLNPGAPDSAHVYGGVPPDAVNEPEMAWPATAAPRLLLPVIVRVEEMVSEYCCDAPRLDTVSVSDTKTVPLKPVVG